MNRKKLWIIIAIATTVVVIILGVLSAKNYYKNKSITSDKSAVTKVSTDFSYAWFNYTKQTSPKYMSTLKPFMTPSFYDATLYINTERPQDFEGQLPMKAQVVSSMIEDYTQTYSTVNVTLEIEEEKSAKITTNILVSLEKVKGDWLVSSFK